MKTCVTISILILPLLMSACATSPKKGVDNDISEKEVILASIKFDPTFIDRWEDRFVDRYIEQEETSQLMSFLPNGSKNTEFDQKAMENERNAVRKKLLEEAKSFDTNKEYLYKYTRGVTLGEYDFKEQKFPLLDIGDFHFTYETGYYPGALFIDFPENFKPEFSIEPEKAQKVLERGLRRDAKQHRKVYPMITFKLVSASPPDRERQQRTMEEYTQQKSRIIGGESRVNEIEQSAGLPPSGRSSKQKEDWKSLNQQEKTSYARNGERLDAVATSLVIYSRPFEFVAYQEILYKAEFNSD